MELIPGTFKYDPSLISSHAFTLASPDYFVLTTMAFLLFLCLTLQIILPYIQGYLLIQKEERLKKDKKRTIQDLIMMREIQTELEQEIEQALLKGAFKSPQSSSPL